MKNSLVKVCCISSLSEAKLALDTGADLLGLVSEMPSGPGVISLEKIAKIVKALPLKTRTILLTSKLTCQDILEQYDVVNTWGIQIVDTLPKEELVKLRKSLPKTHLIQVVHVQDKSSISEALGYTDFVDIILLDSGKPSAEFKTLGGTGDTHDWSISQAICQQSSLPVFLAGGLNPDNIADAKKAVVPSGFDLCSGVRIQGNLDQKKLEHFMRLVHHGQGH